MKLRQNNVWPQKEVIMTLGTKIEKLLADLSGSYFQKARWCCQQTSEAFLEPGSNYALFC